MSTIFYSIFTTNGDKTNCILTYTSKTFSVALIIERLKKIENVITVIQTLPSANKSSMQTSFVCVWHRAYMTSIVFVLHSPPSRQF